MFTAISRWLRGRRALTLDEFCRRSFEGNRRFVFRDVVRRDPCAYCGRAGGTLDHIQPKSKGHKLHWENTTSACYACNVEKGSQSLVGYLVLRVLLSDAARKKAAAAWARKQKRDVVAKQRVAEMQRLLAVALDAQDRGEMGPTPVRRRRRR